MHVQELHGGPNRPNHLLFVYWIVTDHVVKLSILGGGLLGGSLALAATKHWSQEGEVTLWARKEETLATARAMQAGTRWMTDLQEAVHDTEMVVICCPAGAVPHLARQIATALPEDAIVTDVASVKERLVQATREALGQPHRFIGSHPMAGSHRSGIQAARADLYEGAVTIITPLGDEPPSVVQRVSELWKTLACRVVSMSPAAHDQAVAEISHLPHALAAALVNRAQTRPENPVHLVGNGYRDTTRVAEGPAEMWAEILIDNGGHLLNAIEGFTHELNKLAIAVRERDKAQLSFLLEQAKGLREKVSNQQENV